MLRPQDSNKWINFMSLRRTFLAPLGMMPRIPRGCEHPWLGTPVLKVLELVVEFSSLLTKSFCSLVFFLVAMFLFGSPSFISIFASLFCLSLLYYFHLLSILAYFCLCLLLNSSASFVNVLSFCLFAFLTNL